MTQPSDGIDLSKSGWTNPEGFKREPRPNVPAPEVPPVCGDQGPDGWECEYRPGHKDTRHWADNGEPGGIYWERALVDISTLGDMHLPPEERPTIPGQITGVTRGVLGEIARIAEHALKQPSPASWAVALDLIVKAARNVQ